MCVCGRLLLRTHDAAAVTVSRRTDHESNVRRAQLNLAYWTRWPGERTPKSGNRKARAEVRPNWSKIHSQTGKAAHTRTPTLSPAVGKLSCVTGAKALARKTSDLRLWCAFALCVCMYLNYSTRKNRLSGFRTLGWYAPGWRTASNFCCRPEGRVPLLGWLDRHCQMWFRSIGLELV